MAEPLTKDKLYCGCGLGSCTDGNLITVKDLKSALEWYLRYYSNNLEGGLDSFSRNYPELYNEFKEYETDYKGCSDPDCTVCKEAEGYEHIFNKWLIKKAFPAIYEVKL